MSATIINKMLVRAVYDNDICRVNELLVMGADPNYTYKRKGMSCNLPKVCLQYKFTEILKSLLRNGASINLAMKNDLLSEINYEDRELIDLLESIVPAKSKSDQIHYA